MALVADFFIDRLAASGCKHMFGVSGEYISYLVNKISNEKKITFVETKEESGAGFAADAYARTQGVGCVCATYNSGALRLCNAIAGAYTERSPVVVISGSPAIKTRNNDLLTHHFLSGFDSQQKVFENFTCYSKIIHSPDQAGAMIDEAFSALEKYKQPVYLEFPCDVIQQPLIYDVYAYDSKEVKITYDEEDLQEALEEVLENIKNSQNPVILAGVQIARFGLDALLAKFANKYEIPVITTLLGKSLINEYDAVFAGVYSGISSIDNVKKVLQDSDCVLAFGELPIDISLGFQTPKFDKKLMLFCSTEGLKVRNHYYEKLPFRIFCENFFKKDLGKKFGFKKEKTKSSFISNDEKPISASRFFEKVNSIISDKNSVIVDAECCLSEAANLSVNYHCFLSPAFYRSKGFAISGAIGFQLAKKSLRPIVLMNETAFQISFMEIITAQKQQLNPIIFVLSEKGDWSYENISKNVSCFICSNEKELNDVTNQCLSSEKISVIYVKISY